MENSILLTTFVERIQQPFHVGPSLTTTRFEPPVTTIIKTDLNKSRIFLRDYNLIERDYGRHFGIGTTIRVGTLNV